MRRLFYPDKIGRAEFALRYFPLTSLVAYWYLASEHLWGQ